MSGDMAGPPLGTNTLALGVRHNLVVQARWRQEVPRRPGTIRVAFGGNISLGGTVQSGVHIDIVILNLTVERDGKVLLKDGKLYL